MAMCLYTTYTPYDTSSTEQTCDITTFAQFEEVNLSSETCDNAESGDRYDNN